MLANNNNNCSIVCKKKINDYDKRKIDNKDDFFCRVFFINNNILYGEENNVFFTKLGTNCYVLYSNEKYSLFLKKNISVYKALKSFGEGDYDKIIINNKKSKIEFCENLKEDYEFITLINRFDGTYNLKFVKNNLIFVDLEEEIIVNCLKKYNIHFVNYIASVNKNLFYQNVLLLSYEESTKEHIENKINLMKINIDLLYDYDIIINLKNINIFEITSKYFRGNGFRFFYYVKNLNQTQIYSLKEVIPENCLLPL